MYLSWWAESWFVKLNLHTFPVEAASNLKKLYFALMLCWLLLLQFCWLYKRRLSFLITKDKLHAISKGLFGWLPLNFPSKASQMEENTKLALKYKEGEEEKEEKLHWVIAATLLVLHNLLTHSFSNPSLYLWVILLLVMTPTPQPGKSGVGLEKWQAAQNKQGTTGWLTPLLSYFWFFFFGGCFSFEGWWGLPFFFVCNDFVW